MMKMLKVFAVAVFVFVISPIVYGQDSDDILITCNLVKDTTIDYHSEQCEIKCNLTKGTCNIKIGNKTYNKIISAVERKEEEEGFLFSYTKTYYYLHFADGHNHYLRTSDDDDIFIKLGDNISFVLTCDELEPEDYMDYVCFYYDLSGNYFLIDEIRITLGDEKTMGAYGLEFEKSGINYKELNHQSQAQPTTRNNNPTNNSNNATTTKPVQENGTPYKFTCSEGFSSLYIDGNYAGSTPVTKYLEPGLHTVRAEHWKKHKYKTFEKVMDLTSYNTDITIKLKRYLNRLFEFYLEGNYLMNGMTAYGATIGGFLGNFNLEASYYIPTDKVEDIYWCDNEMLPLKSNYTPEILASGKIGFGIRIGTRFRITPQAGAYYLTLKEEIDNNKEIAPNTRGINLVGSLRCSFAVARHLKISVTPEYVKSFKASAGFEALRDVSPTIQNWSDGINIKFGLALFF